MILVKPNPFTTAVRVSQLFPWAHPNTGQAPVHKDEAWLYDFEEKKKHVATFSVTALGQDMYRNDCVRQKKCKK